MMCRILVIATAFCIVSSDQEQKAGGEDYEWAVERADPTTTRKPGPLPGQDWPPKPKKTKICPQFGLRIGQEVVDAVRGKAHVVCRASKDPALVGICGAPNTGHDEYSTCLGGGSRPHFCGPASLWFVRCDAVALQAEMMQPTVLEKEKTCGCSWNAKYGCVVSAEQMLSSISPKKVIGVSNGCESDSINEDPRRLECKIRSEAAEFRGCLGLNPRDCAEAEKCQWGGQASGECGIDEEKLVLRLAGPESHANPLMQLLMLHDHCSKHNEEWCDADSSCSFQPGLLQASCDVNPVIVMKLLVLNPTLALSLYSFKRSSDEQMAKPIEDILNAMCLTSRRKADDECPHPCEYQMKGSSSLLTECVAPISADIQWRNFTALLEPVETSRLVKVISVLVSSTRVIEERCSKLGQSTCQASASACQTSIKEVDGSEEVISGGPALRGVLRSVATAISKDQVGQLLVDFMLNNPSMQNFSRAGLRHISTTLLKQERGTSDADATADEELSKLEKKIEEEESKDEQNQKKQDAGDKPKQEDGKKDDAGSRRRRQRKKVVNSSEVEGENESEDDDGKPWTNFVASALMGAACVGAFIGALFTSFHFRMKNQAREPLLEGLQMSSRGVRGAMREEEMVETVPAMMSPI